MRRGRYTAADRMKALPLAEKNLVRPRDDQPKEVELRASEITTMPVIFQPREADLGLSETDKAYVGKLQRRIDTVGELDPLLVIKVKHKEEELENPYSDDGETHTTERLVWVCIEGHHRLQAYHKNKYKEPIKCEWFDGTVREAMDESLRRNIALKLPVPLADRQEEAWRRVLMEDYSKKHIKQTCGVAEGTVSLMRRVKARYEDRSRRANADKEFRATIQASGGLAACAWWAVHLAHRSATTEQRTLEQKAQSFAKVLRTKLTDRLSKDAWVTARAIEIRDPDLPILLQAVWGSRTLREIETMSGAALQQLLQTNLQETQKIEAEIARRQAGGSPSDSAWLSEVDAAGDADEDL
jgi:hypothetical protein